MTKIEIPLHSNDAKLKMERYFLTSEALENSLRYPKDAMYVPLSQIILAIFPVEENVGE